MKFNFSKGQQIYKYKLDKKLGNGSFGEVWLAEDTNINQIVALKILPSDFAHITTTLEEAKNGNKVTHQNLLEIIGADYVPIPAIPNLSLVLIAQKYQKYGSITNFLNARNFLPLPRLLKCLQDIAAGLEYLHHGNIIHNDIKPGNILVDDNDNAVLADYGISSVLENGTNANPKKIYLLHGAPEVLNNVAGISATTDIYQLGCTAYRLANGIDELSCINMTREDIVKAKNVRKLPSSIHQPYVPKKLARIINKATEVNPNKRFQSVLEFRRELEKLSFPGYWTTDDADTTKLIGKGQTYIYDYEIKPKPGDVFDFEAKRTNIKNGKSNRITDFCKKNLTKKDKDKHLYHYFEWVINNAR